MKYRIFLLIFALAFSVTMLWAVGWYIAKPANEVIAMPTKYESVSINGTRGSFLKSGDNHICALLLHGIRSNRTSMIDRSTFLADIGISSLLIDLQAHGETPGDIITFGYRESVDAGNGVYYLRKDQSCKEIVAIGESLGGASTLLGNGSINVDALILESVYPTIEEAVEDRLDLRFGAIGKFLAPLLYWQIPVRTGVPLSELRPIDRLKEVKVPVYIMGGSEDLRTKAIETKRMFEVANEPKCFWLVKGAIHQDLFAYDPTGYKARVSGFIKQFM